MKGGRGGVRGTTEEEGEERRGRWTGRLMDRSLLSAAPTAQLSLRRSWWWDRTAGPGVTLAASDGTFGVIGGDTTPGRNALERQRGTLNASGGGEL